MGVVESETNRSSTVLITIDLNSNSDLIIENPASTWRVNRQPAPGVRVRRGLDKPNPHPYPSVPYP